MFLSHQYFVIRRFVIALYCPPLSLPLPLSTQISLNDPLTRVFVSFSKVSLPPELLVCPSAAEEKEEEEEWRSHNNCLMPIASPSKEPCLSFCPSVAPLLVHSLSQYSSPVLVTITCGAMIVITRFAGHEFVIRGRERERSQVDHLVHVKELLFFFCF